MLTLSELRQVAERFGVDDLQVRRDHLISHLLAAISTLADTSAIFFGGTALARSILTDGRLSEDIDLLALDSRPELAARLHSAIPRQLRREYPGLTWERTLTTGRDTDPAVLRTPDGVAVRMQLLNAIGYPPWPTHRVDLEQRYSDAPAATLTVLTPAGFVAAKTAAWRDRHAARDLWDLWALAQKGHITREAADLYARIGPTNHRPDPAAFATAPHEQHWRRDLGGQVRLTVTATEAVTVVRGAWSRVSNPTAS